VSKAFTKEDDGGEDDLGEIPQPTGSPCITRDGFKKLSAEFDQLWRVERPKVTTEVMWAAAQGDRSENAEYIYGKRRLREIDRRVRFLKKRMESVTVIEPAPEQAGRVFFGATVDVEDDDGKRSRYRLIGTDEIDLKRGWISIESPIGKALLGKVVGDEVLVHRPKGETTLTVRAITYEE
jgi:transcription elongation factor GreB